MSEIVTVDSKQIEKLLAHAYDLLDSKSYDEVLEICKAMIMGNRFEELRFGEILKPFIKVFKSFQSRPELLLNLLNMIMDRNPTLSDDAWFTFYLKQNDIRFNYKNYFAQNTEFGSTTITNSLLGRRQFRDLFPKGTANFAKDDETLQLPSFDEMMQNLLTAEQVTNEVMQKRMFTIENVTLIENEQAFVTFFEKYLQLYSDKNEFILEVLSDCLYLHLDGDLLPPCSGLQAVTRDNCIHRVVRYFLAESSVYLISKIISRLSPEHYKQFSLNFRADDRLYLQDGLLDDDYLTVKIWKSFGNYNPFTLSFSKYKQNYMDVRFDLNRELPPEPDMILKQSMMYDQLQKSIVDDYNFRNLTERQIEEWYSTSDISKGGWDNNFMVAIDSSAYHKMKPAIYRNIVDEIHEEVEEFL